MSWENLGFSICGTVFTVDSLYRMVFLGLGLLYRGLLILGIRSIGDLLHSRDISGLLYMGRYIRTCTYIYMYTSEEAIRVGNSR